MKKEDWARIEEQIKDVLEITHSLLDAESMKSVNHYLAHGEYEMAFEGLFIEIMRLKKVPRLKFVELHMIGKTLSLDKETIFEDDFWERFENFIDQNCQ